MLVSSHRGLRGEKREDLRCLWIYELVRGCTDTVHYLATFISNLIFLSNYQMRLSGRAITWQSAAIPFHLTRQWLSIGSCPAEMEKSYSESWWVIGPLESFSFLRFMKQINRLLRLECLNGYILYFNEQCLYWHRSTLSPTPPIFLLDDCFVWHSDLCTESESIQSDIAILIG